jgi:hypothetical protein
MAAPPCNVDGFATMLVSLVMVDQSRRSPEIAPLVLKG